MQGGNLYLSKLQGVQKTTYLEKGPVVSECLKDFVSCPGGYTGGVDSAHFRAPIAEMPHSDSLKIRGLE